MVSPFFHFLCILVLDFFSKKIKHFNCCDKKFIQMVFRFITLRSFSFPGDSGIGSSGVGNNDSIASESVPSSATERRAVVLSSAGKKLPWDPNPLPQQPSPNHHLHMDLDSHDHLPNGFKVCMKCAMIDLFVHYTVLTSLIFSLNC